MDIDDDAVTDPAAEFGELFEGQTVAFESELGGHDADDVLGAIGHEIGLATSSHHHRSSHHPSDHEILAANLPFVPDDYFQHQQIVIDGEMVPISDVTGLVDHQGQAFPQQHLDGLGQQIYIHSGAIENQMEMVDGTQAANAQISYKIIPVTLPNQVETGTIPPELPFLQIKQEPQLKSKIKVLKDVKYFTNENMERYMKRRGFQSKRVKGSVEPPKSISKGVFAMTAASQMNKSNTHIKLVSFGSRYEPECVVQEMERFWKFYVWTKSRNLAMSLELLPMLFPMLLHFYFEMMLAHVNPIARRICLEFSKKFLQEDKTQEHYDILVAILKVNSTDTLKSDAFLRSLINQNYEFTVSEFTFVQLRRFLSKSSQPTLVNLFTDHFTIRMRESAELIESLDWESMLDQDDNSESSGNSEDEEEKLELTNGKPDKDKASSYAQNVIDELRSNVKANLPALSVFTTGNNPVSGAVSKRGTMLAFGLQESGIRVYPVEKSRDITKINPQTIRPTDPEAYGVKCVGGHAGTVYGLQFHPSAKLLFSAGEDRLMRVWDLTEDNPQCRAVYRGHTGPIWKLDIPDSGSLVATAGLDTTARIFLPERTEFVRVMVGHYFSVNSVKFHPNEAYIATGSADKSVRLWSVNDGNIVRMYTGSEGTINCLAFHESGKYLAGAGEDRKIIIWDLASGEVVATIECLPNCRDIAFSGNMLSVCCRNGSLQIYNLRPILGGSEQTTNSDGSFEEHFSGTVATPFTTKCFAKTLFKVHYKNPGQLYCLGSDLTNVEEEFDSTPGATAQDPVTNAPLPTDNHNNYNNTAPIISSTPIINSQSQGITMLHKVLQNTPGQSPASTSTSTGPMTSATTDKAKQSGTGTTTNSSDASRILAARLSQPLSSSSSTCDDAGDHNAIFQEGPLSAGPPIGATSTSAPMISSSELDAAIASVIDQSGGDTSGGAGGTITMYASS